MEADLDTGAAMLQATVNTLRAHGHRLRAEVVDTYLGMRGIKYSLARRIRELEQQREFLTRYSDPSAPVHSATEFDFCTDYPAHLPLVQALGHDTHHYRALHAMWSKFAFSCRLVTWTEVRNTHALKFLRWCNSCIASTRAAMHICMMPCSRDTPPQTGDDLPPWHFDEKALRRAVEQDLFAMERGGKHRQAKKPGHTAVSKPYDREKQSAILRERTLLACARIWGLDTHIGWHATTKVVGTSVWVSPDPVYRDLQVKKDLSECSVTSAGLFACWSLPDNTQAPFWQRQQLSHIQNALQGPAPIRVVLMVPHSHHVWDTCHAHVFPPHTYAIAQGSTKVGDHWSILCIQNSAAAALRPVCHADVTNQLGPLLRRWGLPMFPTPSHTACPVQVPVPAPHSLHTSSRTIFWTVWHTECKVRREAMATKTWRQACRASYARANQVLRYAPCAWLRLLVSQMDDRWLNSLETAGTWVYAAWSPLDGRIYYGQTGAKGEIKSVADRFQEEIADAQAFAKLYTSKGKRGPTYLRTMARLHPSNFCVTVLRKVLRTSADGQERAFIHRNPHNLNDKRPRRKPYMRWLLRSGLYTQLTSSALQDKEKWLHYIRTSRLQLHPMDALRILIHARGAIPQGQFSQLQTRLLQYVKQQTGMILPPSLTFKLPSITKEARRMVQRSAATFFRRTRYPRPVAQYLTSIVQVPLRVPSRVLHAFCRDKVSVSLDTLTKLAADPNMCGCRRNAGYDACAACVLYHPASLTRVFGHAHSQVLSAQNNYTCVPSKKRNILDVAESLGHVRRQLPKVRVFAFRRLAAQVYQVVKRCQMPCAGSVDPRPSRAEIRDFHETFPAWRPVRLDKNAHRFAVLCTAMYCACLCKIFTASVNYKRYHRAPSTYALYATYTLYFLILARMLPAVRNHCSTIYMRTRLSTMVPAYKDVRVPMPPHLPPPPTGDSTGAEWNAFRDEIFEHAMTVAEEATSLRPLVVQPARAVDTPRVKLWQVPGVTVPLKGKCIGSGDTIDPALAKYREIFTQVHHPLSSLLKKCSRVATVMLKQYTHSFMTLEILDQAHLVWGFLQPAREWYARTNTPVGVFELDLERMFPSIQRNRVPQAWKNLASRFSKMLPTRRGTDDLFVAVAKGQSKDMDVFGAHSSKYYENFSLSEFHTLVCLDLYTNGLFQLGHELWDQVTGVAIGGPLSAQNASAVCMEAESNVPWGSVLPSHIKLGRFRDNIFCVCPLHEIPYWMGKVRALLERIYGMTLSVEQAGRSATFLELQIECQGPALEWGLKQKVILSHLSPTPPVSRYPSPAEPHAAEVVHGLACSLATKCATIASTPRHKCENFSHTYWELQDRGYPKRWWEPVLRSAFNRQRDISMSWSTLTASLTWTCPVPPGYALMHPDVPLPQFHLSTGTPSVDDFFQAWFVAGGTIPPRADALMAIVDPILFPTILHTTRAAMPARNRHPPRHACIPRPASKRTGRKTHDKRAPVPTAPKAHHRKRKRTQDPPPPRNEKAPHQTPPAHTAPAAPKVSVPVHRESVQEAYQTPIPPTPHA